MRTMTIFPAYDVRENLMETNVRKLHTDGKWYLMLIKTGSVYPVDEGLKHTFLKNVYMAILWGIINPELKEPMGQDIFLLDPNQQSEEERLIPTFYKPL